MVIFSLQQMKGLVEHMGSLMQSIGSTNASGNEDDATSTLPVITLRNFNKCIRE